MGYNVKGIDSSVQDFYRFLKKNKIQGKVLDIGCGNGRNSVYFASKGFDVLGIDFTKAAVSIAERYAKSKKSKANFKVMNVLSDNFKFKQKFDIVLDCGCLHHIRRKYWKKYLKNVLESVKKGGYFYLHGFSDNSHKLGFVKKGQRYKLKKGHYTCFFSDEEIEKLFGKDFKIIKKSEFVALNKKFIVNVFWMEKK